MLSYPNNDATDVTLAENCSFSTIKKASVQYDGSAKNRYQTEFLNEGVTLPEGPLFYITYKISDTAAAGTSSEISLYGTDKSTGSALMYLSPRNMISSSMMSTLLWKVSIGLAIAAAPCLREMWPN